MRIRITRFFISFAAMVFAAVAEMAAATFFLQAFAAGGHGIGAKGEVLKGILKKHSNSARAHRLQFLLFVDY